MQIALSIFDLRLRDKKLCLKGRVQIMSEFNNDMELNEDEELFVTLELDDGKELECQVIMIFEVEGQDYIALLPTEGEEYENGEVYLYKYDEDEEGNPSLDNIESEEEYEMVADAFDEILDEEEYDEIVGEDEE